MSVLQDLAAQVPDACISPGVWRHHRSRVNERLKSEHASRLVTELQFQSDIKRICKLPSIASTPLIDSEDGLVHDTEALATIPPGFKDYWTSGPLSYKPQPKWTKFHRISFENAQSLLRQAGACGGCYQIWLSRSELQPDGISKMVMRTELYVGSGIGGHIISELQMIACQLQHSKVMTTAYVVHCQKHCHNKCNLWLRLLQLCV